MSSWSVVSLVHLIGLSLGVGAATVKLTLLLRARNDRSLLPAFRAVSKPITRFIVLGLILLTVSGIAFLVMGYPTSPLMVGKLVAVGAMWGVGPYIDNVSEPRFWKVAPLAGEEPSAEFLRVESRHVRVEAAATVLFYLITLLGVAV